jgi:hypothetical protein
VIVVPVTASMKAGVEPGKPPTRVGSDSDDQKRCVYTDLDLSWIAGI